jgi:hypothetical protein
MKIGSAAADMSLRPGNVLGKTQFFRNREGIIVLSINALILNTQRAAVARCRLEIFFTGFCCEPLSEPSPGSSGLAGNHHQPVHE